MRGAFGSAATRRRFRNFCALPSVYGATAIAVRILKIPKRRRVAALPRPPMPARRQFLRDAFCGFGSLAAGGPAPRRAPAGRNRRRQSAGAAPAALAPGEGRSVIFLFMAGGPSHLETFDPKPLLNKLDGQPRPAEFGEAKYQFVQQGRQAARHRAARSRKHGQSGIEVSDLFPHTAQCIDDIAVVRSCHGDMVVHSAAQYELFSGRVVPGFPSMGSWVVYGLGSREPSRCRPTSSCPTRTARSRPGSRCTPTASCRPSISRRCSARGARAGAQPRPARRA